MKRIDQTTLDELTKLEEDLWKTETRFNQAYMRELMSPDFLEYGCSGKVYDLEDVLSIEYQDIEAAIPLPNIQVRQISNNVAQVTYNSSVGSGEKVENARRSSIWSRSGGNWKLRFHQGTPYDPDT